tara:strand:- start:165 stop:455 length:291 start_codon:yes stop_codon:yes gene_type:complete
VKKEKARFSPGDLVTYYEFATYYYGEGAVKYKGQGIILETHKTEWNSELQDWVQYAMYQTHDVVRYKVLCLKTGRRLVLGGKALILISKANENNGV